MNHSCAVGAVCPICGASNSCALANQSAAHSPCWCVAVQISPKVLANIPEALVNKVCICPTCAGLRTPVIRIKGERPVV